ncbi:SGNH/GDSL hydrolase family protein [Sphingomonas sp.]|uniref:SGNH/GDSL hydrolase family protein n=1 Tax=Sphingomonas sp. TaxID=28214 RepID=UPI000DB34FB2|nr:SGNH/GDSL hydrolase family protein [Sphingomonas sp.]PZU11787.1 MAG: hypothetical protein DI605_02130 [Sphingomonas sp.]
MLLLGAALTTCAPSRAPTPPPPAEALARSLGLIRTATSTEPHVVRLLFYGQSISTPKWTAQAVAHLTQTYPNVRFVVRNLAIGGFAAQTLKRTVERDVTAFYPDLIVFHVYGDHRDYERIIRTIRATTPADLIVQTDHLSTDLGPLCDEGLHLSLASRPGCKGRLWYRATDWESHMSWSVIPGLAAKYGFAVEPRRDEWIAYLGKTGLPAAALIADSPHPNARGWSVMALLFGRWFDRAVASWNGQRSTAVTDLPATSRTFDMTGNRIEIIASGPLDGKVTATIDGKRPQDLDGCWQTSRTTALPEVRPWPALRQVTIDPADHQADRFTLTLTHFDPSQAHFRFALTSAARGPDGAGSSDSDFVSPSGRVRISKEDWTLAESVAHAHRGVPEGFKVEWRRAFVCRDQPAVPLTAGTVEQRHLIATGIRQGPHKVNIRVSPDAERRIRAIRIYRPPLDDAA